ncbi:MAG: hypothetical protein AB7K41_15285 [Bdellovibrionales bacterium]|nr:hypothetical protein [Nitrosomonas nitrosa]
MDKIIELIAGSSLVAVIAAISIGLVTISWVIIVIVSFFQGRRISLGPVHIDEKQKPNTGISKNGSLLTAHKYVKPLPDKWIGSWEYLDKSDKNVTQERLFITEQIPAKEGLNIKGYFTVDAEPEKRWEFSGNFTGKFIQLYYYPSDAADDGLFLDYGCYFFEIKNDGHFEGFSVACEWDEEIPSVARHMLKELNNKYDCAPNRALQWSRRR